MNEFKPEIGIKFSELTNQQLKYGLDREFKNSEEMYRVL